MSTPTRGPGRLRVLVRAVDHSRPVRAVIRYLLVRGTLSAGGVTISALVSLVALVTIATTILRSALAERPELFEWVIDSVNTVLPGLVDDGTNNGLLDPANLALSTSFTWATLISVPVLLWTATNVMTGLRNSIRSMFGLTGAPIRPLIGKLYDVVGILLLGTAILISSALVAGTSGAVRAVLGLFEMEGTGPIARVVAVLTAGVVDALVFIILFRVAAKVRVPLRDRVLGALLGAVGWGLLRLAGTTVIGLWHNPLLASFAVLVTLLVWINLAVRWALYVAAWTANPPHTQLPVPPHEVHARETPNYVTLSVPHTLAWPHHEVTGTLIPDDTLPRSPDPS